MHSRFPRTAFAIGIRVCIRQYCLNRMRDNCNLESAKYNSRVFLYRLTIGVLLYAYGYGHAYFILYILLLYQILTEQTCNKCDCCTQMHIFFYSL